MRDHPRTCGENKLIYCFIVQIAGSPPHLRGKPIEALPKHHWSRITPAPAGKTTISEPSFPKIKDHPRTCGENVYAICVLPQSLGSPPHLRGKLCCQTIRLSRIRITPAPAGKTPLFLCSYLYCEDHPRTCGENWLKLWLVAHGDGSPPHLRGKPE